MTQIKECQHCGGEFEANRKDKIYCSDKCKMASWIKSKEEKDGPSDRTLGQIPQTSNMYSMMMSNPNESVYRFAYEQEKEARQKAEARLEKSETALEENRKAMHDLEKEIIRKENEIQRFAEKEEEGGEGLAGLTKNPEALANSINAFAGLLTALRAPVPGVEGAAQLQGVDLDKQKKAIEYANFLAQTEDPEQVHSTLHLLARVKKTINEKIFEEIETYLKQNYYDAGRKQATI